MRSASGASGAGDPATLSSSLFRLAGLLLLLLLVAPLSSIQQSILLWSERQQLHADGSDSVRAAANGAAEAVKATKTRQQSQRRETQESGSTSGGSVTTIGHFVLNDGNRNIEGGSSGSSQESASAADELLFTMLGMGFGGIRKRRGMYGGLGGAGNDRDVGLMYGTDFLGMTMVGYGGGGMVNELALGFQIIMPWLLALVLGVVVPAILTVVSHVRSRRFREYYKGLDRKEKRLFRLVLCLKRFKTTIQEGNLLDASTVDDTTKENEARERNDGNHSSEADTLLSIPLPGEPLLTEDELKNDDVIPHREVPASCAICLDPYRVGDIVVWSSNENCRDVFHESCIISWLTKKRNARCPCCRQQFIDQVLRSQAGFR
mmetsp:Transcript_25114/g.54393  ORF Transcript_25114/g.54393 Transcript_25114/m.54393 type:complete len:376 (+) Transcript_25114:207-1334(+)